MTENKNAEVVICGAGIAGIAAAYQLAVKQGVNNILLVDPRPPMTMTSDKSFEGYRNWWPGPDDSMVSLMNRSIDILEELHKEVPGRLPMNRRGYFFATSNPDKIEGMIAGAQESCELGAGELRIHRGEPGDPQYIPLRDHGLFDAPAGADILLDQNLIQKHFPYMTEKTVAVLHARRCGWFAAQQFGMYMLEQARENGVEFVSAKVVDVLTESGKVEGVVIRYEDGSQQTITTSKFVNAAGPLQKEVGEMFGVEIPVFSELHVKASISDHQEIVPRDTPLTIWLDPVTLPWSDEEREMLVESEETAWLTEEMPEGVHGRPEGSGHSDQLIIQWGYDIPPVEATFPPEFDPMYPEISLRGLATVIPGLAPYVEKMPKPFIDGGYYTRTPENRPLIGPTSVEGAYLFCGIGGFGMQVSCGAAELLAAHITGSELPHYAPAFLLSRYEDPEYQKLVEQWGASGQI